MALLQVKLLAGSGTVGAFLGYTATHSAAGCMITAATSAAFADYLALLLLTAGALFLYHYRLSRLSYVGALWTTVAVTCTVTAATPTVQSSDFLTFLVYSVIGVTCSFLVILAWRFLCCYVLYDQDEDIPSSLLLMHHNPYTLLPLSTPTNNSTTAGNTTTDKLPLALRLLCAVAVITGAAPACSYSTTGSAFLWQASLFSSLVTAAAAATLVFHSTHYTNK
jgi:hypothetical protein